jgi:hypothetical protein
VSATTAATIWPFVLFVSFVDLNPAFRLNVPSRVKARLATVEASLVLKIVARRSARDRTTLDGHLRQWLPG